MINVLFFARIREQLGTAKLTVPFEKGNSTIATLIESLIEANGDYWSEILLADNVVMAVNQEVADSQRQLVSGDEVAFFPPVTGG